MADETFLRECLHETQERRVGFGKYHEMGKTRRRRSTRSSRAPENCCEHYMSTTWYSGTEVHAHRQFTLATGVRVFLCDSQSSGQHGGCENTNGLLRQYTPPYRATASGNTDGWTDVALALKGVRQGRGWGRSLSRVLGVLLLFAVPIGTILGAFVLIRTGKTDWQHAAL